MKKQWFYIDINPEPWAIGPIGIGKKNGKFFPYVGPNEQLVTYQEAIKEYFQELNPEFMYPKDKEGRQYILNLYFWRRLDKYITASGVTKYKNSADATNLGKSTEDALQGILFINDRFVRRITSTIVEQDVETLPGVAICIESFSNNLNNELPVLVKQERRMSYIKSITEKSSLNTNVWTGPK